LLARNYIGSLRLVKNKAPRNGAQATRPRLRRKVLASKNLQFPSGTLEAQGEQAAALLRDLLESARWGNLMKLDLLVIAAHPDDAELTCGGTLLKMARRGYKTGILDLTAGEMGTRGTPETRAKEAAKAAKLLGVSWRGTLGVPDSDVQPSRQHKLKLASVVRSLRPKTVILPYWEARHPDHYHASTLAYEGCFLAGLKALPIEGEAYRPFKILYATSFAGVRPTFVVDISKEFEQRRKAILAFGSQFRPVKGEAKSKVFLAIDRLEDEMNQLARHYGQMIGVKYGEGFLTKELMQIEDVVNLPVRSI
jgi:bacillithiol biosynthesis deacetylase BshB1